MRAIAIDGPAASGKSTVGYMVAQSSDFLFFDTGIMYRAVTWAVLQEGIDSSDSAAIARAAGRTEVEIRTPAPGERDGRQVTVLVGAEDVTWRIRSLPVDRNVSAVAADRRVRQALSRQQRKISLHYAFGRGDRTGIVVVGRDIGTEVLPEAPLKIFLEAPLEERARRRFQELSDRGKETDPGRVLDDLYQRDTLDARREFSPLRPADDAVLIQTLGRSAKQVADTIAALAQVRLEAGEEGSAQAAPGR